MKKQRSNKITHHSLAMGITMVCRYQTRWQTIGTRCKQTSENNFENTTVKFLQLFFRVGRMLLISPQIIIQRKVLHLVSEEENGFVTENILRSILGQLFLELAKIPPRYLLHCRLKTAPGAPVLLYKTAPVVRR